MASNMAHWSPILAEPASPTEPGDLRGHVGENVAIEIGHHDHVERFRRIGHLGRADVHDPVLVLDVRILRGDFVEDLVEQAVGHLHDVVFGEAGDLLAVVAARVFERVADDLFAARPRDQLEALHDFRAELVLDARVEILFVLAHDHHVHVGMLGVDERMIGNARPHVGVEAQRLARGDVEALEAAALRGGDGRFRETLWCGAGIPRRWVRCRRYCRAGRPSRRFRWSRCRGPRRRLPGSASVASMISGPMPSPCATVMGVLLDIGKPKDIGLRTIAQHCGAGSQPAAAS